MKTQRIKRKAAHCKSLIDHKGCYNKKMEKNVEIMIYFW
jgi:hypothetical protein